MEDRSIPFWDILQVSLVIARLHSLLTKQPTICLRWKPVINPYTSMLTGENGHGVEMTEAWQCLAYDGVHGWFLHAAALRLPTS